MTTVVPTGRLLTSTTFPEIGLVEFTRANVLSKPPSWMVAEVTEVVPLLTMAKDNEKPDPSFTRGGYESCIPIEGVADELVLVDVVAELVTDVLVLVVRLVDAEDVLDELDVPVVWLVLSVCVGLADAVTVVTRTVVTSVSVPVVVWG